MSPATTNGRYTRRDARGRIEQLNDDGLKLDGIWWNQSQRQPVDLTGFKVGDLVEIAASETLDGRRRFILELSPLQTARTALPAAPYQFVDDWPDELSAEQPAGTQATSGQPPAASALPLAPSRHEIADRLACLQIAAGAMTPGWTKRGEEPNAAVLIGIADHLLDWLYRLDRDGD